MCVQGTGLTLTLKTLHVCHMPSHSLNKLLAAMTNLEYELLLIYTNCWIVTFTLLAVSDFCLLKGKTPPSLFPSMSVSVLLLNVKNNDTCSMDTKTFLSRINI